MSFEEWEAPKKVQAENLPKGWVWTHWDDASGHLESPDGKDYFSYDWSTGEYKITPDRKYDFFLKENFASGGYSIGSFSEFKEYAEKWVSDHIIEKEVVKTVSPSEKKTIVVNLFAGPGAGKTTCAWEIASELKKRGIETEYVSEFAKELVWENKLDLLDGSLEHQTYIYQEQNKRVQRLLGKVDVVVTDSPSLLSLMYLKELDPIFEQTLLSNFNSQQNFNLFINRGKLFQQAGRLENLEESKVIDKRIIEFLEENNIYFGTYYHKTVGVLIDNIVKNLNNVNSKDAEKKPSVRQKLQDLKSPEQQNLSGNAGIRSPDDIVSAFIAE